jgi:hypothetical protein
LTHADHDYDGHRAKAAEEVHKALKELGHHHKKAAPAPVAAPGAVVATKPVHASAPKVREPQAASDAKLREAKDILQAVSTHLTGKHPKAAANVQAAIAEINTALAIK